MRCARRAFSHPETEIDVAQLNLSIQIELAKSAKCLFENGTCPQPSSDIADTIRGFGFGLKKVAI